ncbi:MAG: hypothetical protein KF897_02515 [Opitutaceae bacterium]|nr:hypothetical protein [Opitutaceae bacterium]
MAESYFPDSAPALSARLDAYLAALAERLAAAPFAPAVTVLALGGGYGRGEGGIFRATPDAEPTLYNDLEFYLVVQPRAADPARAWAAAEAHRGETAVGIEVEFKVLAAPALAAAAPSMFYCDLVAGHRFVWGDAAFLPGLAPRLGDPTRIPAHEATRLLFNRGAGLFYAQCALARGDSRVHDGFVERNHAKCRLALADAVLALNGRHHGSCRERAARLAGPLGRVPPGWAQLRDWHREGVEFKLHPRHRHPEAAALGAAQAQLATAWREVFLWAEGLRLGRTFPDATAYATASGRLLPEFSAARNVLLHLRDRLRRGGALPGWTDYPRAALQRCLGPLLANDDAGRRLAAGLLGCAPETAALESAFRRWWVHYN